MKKTALTKCITGALLAYMVVGFASLSAQTQTAGEAETRAEMVAYLKQHWQSPEEYILEKFATHDVVLLAETHALKHNLQLVHGLIPLLYKSGIYNLGMEFGAAEDQQELDRLVNAPEYNENVARRLMFNYNVGWAYKEYMDVYRKAWELNRSLPAGAPRFRIVNLSYKYDSPKMRLPKTPYVVQKVFYKGNTEEFRAGVVEKEVLAKHGKILILTGTIHAFTKYRMPEYDYYSPGFVMLRDVTLGNLLEKRHPGRNFTILLHIPWDSKDMSHQVRPLGGVIDDAMSGFENKRVGFDTKGSPFDTFVETSSFYATGYPQFTLSTIADGYIYEKPFNEYQGCTVDEEFLTEQNWPEAKEWMPDPELGAGAKTLGEFQKKIRDYVDMKQRLRDVL